jgi:pre-rRNA-processing protein IPI1
VPFFTITHPVRGQVPGPFTKIPSSVPHIRRFALELCVCVLAAQTRHASAGDSGLSKAVSAAVEGTPEEEYWVRVTEAMRLG